MVAKEATKLGKIVDTVVKLATNFGVNKVSYDSNNEITIVYGVLGQGTHLTNLIGDTLDKEYPEIDYNLKMIPSDLTLVINLW